MTNKQEYISILASQAQSESHVYAACAGRAEGIIKGEGSNDEKIAELENLFEALEEVTDVFLRQG